MIVWLLVSLLAPLGLGLALVRLTWPDATAFWAGWLLFGPSIGGYALVETVIAMALLGWSLLTRPRAATERDVSAPIVVSSTRLPTPVVVGMALVCAAGLAALAISLLSSPHGAYDAWAIWNIHARFLYRGGDHWRDLFLPGSSAHPDYPLLVPAIVARCWFFIGHETAAAPALLAALFTLATVGILVATLALTRNIVQACLAAAFLLGTSHYIYDAAGQMADVLLSAFFLAPLALLSIQACWWRSRPGQRMKGCCSWVSSAWF